MATSTPDTCLETLSSVDISDEEEKKKFQCKICGREFNYKCNLKAHGVIHTGEKNYKCVICGKEFLRNCDLKSHMNVHAGEESYKCEICDKEFPDKALFNTHMFMHTGLKRYKCEFCWKEFVQYTSIMNHTASHTGEKKHKCEICGKAFLWQFALNAHLKVHTGEKNYKCPICGKEFSQNSHLKEHMRLHSGSKDFKCDICGKSFPQKVSLRLHIEGHTGTKCFCCDVCGKEFAQKKKLGRHMKTHTGEKNFKCPDCGRAFLVKFNLKAHMAVHTKHKKMIEKMSEVKGKHQCQICYKVFQHRSNLTKHCHSHGEQMQKALGNYHVEPFESHTGVLANRDGQIINGRKLNKKTMISGSENNDKSLGCFIAVGMVDASEMNDYQGSTDTSLVNVSGKENGTVMMEKSENYSVPEEHFVNSENLVEVNREYDICEENRLDSVLGVKLEDEDVYVESK